MYTRRSLLRTTGVATVATAGLAGCLGGNGDDEDETSGEDELADEVNVAIYGGAMGDGISETILDGFEDEYDITVNAETYPDNWDLIAQVQAGSTDLDVLILDDTAVPSAVSDDLVQPIREENVPNLDEIMADFSPYEQAFDPGDEIHYGPFQFFGDGLAYNADVLSEPQSWEDVYTDETEGSVIYTSWIDRVVGIAASHEGLSVSELDQDSDAEMEQIWDRVESMNEYVFEWADTGGILQDSFANEQALAGMLWYGRVAALQDDDVAVEYTIPEEGAPMATSGFSVSADTNRRYTAETFIDYTLDPDTQYEYSSVMGYAPTAEMDEVPELVENSPDYQNRDRLNFWNASLLVENMEEWSLEFQETIGG
ncbi:extracellular solute-binding protein [Natrarchaeobius halalkaliphilus]|uniref:Extracellular solute-binding protein n=1 Tax=Natrarchaeobius halalkaliphilus TaxID=1679091 RepID=A0A3N6LJB8_9EURY|nr:PotD/PotF family extracellular solute-binding protein [Natrarchaeobius halalkaliphilus]RQG87991.1 extracellular solute-binding protein [Natrarchaeobius halalkaliphilus]